MKPDLTRWNRAGLKRFRYVDGNAATYLEALRQELFARLAGWEMELLGIERKGDGQEELEKYIDRFGKDHRQALDNYLSLNDERGSVALEMIRSFARATHVLTEHLDAYANEGFLGTATQWESVRRLVHGLDYHPKPPASAMTHLVLNAKPGQSGPVSRGLQIKHTPEGSSPVVFETLEDIQIDPVFNVLRLKDWSRSPEKAEAINNQLLTLDCIVDGLKHGDPVIIENQEKNWLLPCLLENTDVEGESTILNLNLPAGQDLGCRGDVLIHLKPAEKLEVFAPTRALTYQGAIPLVITLKEGPSIVALQEAFEKAEKDNQEMIVFLGNRKAGYHQGTYRTVLKIEDRKVILASVGAGREYDTMQELIENAEYLSLTHTLISRKDSNDEDTVWLPGDLTSVEDFPVLVSMGSREFSNTYRQGEIAIISTDSGSPVKNSQVSFHFGVLPYYLHIDHRVEDYAAVCIPSTDEKMSWQIAHIDQPANGFFHPDAIQKNISLILLLSPIDRLAQTAVSTLILEEEPVGLQEELEKAKEDERDLVLFIGKGNVGIYRKLIKVNGKQLVLSSTVADENLKIELDYVGIAAEIYSRSDESGYITIEKDRPSGSELSLTQGRPPFEESDKSVSERLDGATVYMRWLTEGFHLLYREAQLKDAQIKSKDDDSVFKVILGDEQFLWEKFMGTPADFTIFIPPGPNQEKWKINPWIEHGNTLWQTNAVKRIARNDLCAAACGSNLMAARIQNITEEGGGRSGLRVDNWQPAELAEEREKFIRNQTAVFGKFKEQVRLKDWNVNETLISGKSRLPEAVTQGEPKGWVNTLTLENKEAAGQLKAGKFVVVEQEAPEPRLSVLTSVQYADKRTGVVRLDPALPDEYLIGSTLIRANVVRAGHGEAQPEKILGSGNATLSNQEFLFSGSDVSFISDETQVSGVRADIKVIVDGETWTQVSRFNQSRPTDIHYAVRMTEEGHLRIVFGDGINGRRLPTGENNVRIAWRTGSGTAGNLKAGSLKKPAHPHPRVEAIDQPFDCGGGNDMESVTSLRRSAPASLLTMERAVSVNDFAELAASHASIWSARAELQSSAGERAVRVVVVPADGGKLGETLSKDLEASLLSHAIPGAHVKLDEYVSEALALEITLGINSTRFDVDAVIAEVRETLLQRFTLKNRTIGAPVYLSDIYQCVEAVRGVEYSVCKFMVDAKESDVQFRYPKDLHSGVLHIADDEDGDDITLIHEEAKK